MGCFSHWVVLGLLLAAPMIVGARSRSSARTLFWCAALVLTPFVAFVVVVEHPTGDELLAFTTGAALIAILVSLVTYWIKALILEFS
jgi:uncharacterized membrane protein YhaH (DUF805 family)